MHEQAWLIRIYGIVQGVGFRPFVRRLADRFGLSGTVCNRGSYVEIYAQGPESVLSDFTAAISSEAPERSAILKIEATPVPADYGDSFDTPKFPGLPHGSAGKTTVSHPADPTAGQNGTFASAADAVIHTSIQPAAPDRFRIIESEKESGDIFVSPDIAICPKCRKELYDRGNRRYLHPFINCTACGPRLTILDAMPYDRERTSMREFPMCGPCRAEYEDLQSRRYDAQPVCCPDCGPQIYIPGTGIRSADALRRTREIIKGGGIAAIKGIGGFHLCCDATNAEAVARLRVRKMRPAKPFAVMAHSIESIRRVCHTTEAMEAVLDGHQKPIVLLEKRADTDAAFPHPANNVAPDNPKLGMMLPYTPLHLLLFDCDDDLEMPDYLVMTSANESGAPICITEEEVQEQIGDICDVILSHNRQIRLQADDSVVDFYKDEPYMIRRSRGYAPLPFYIEETTLKAASETKENIPKSSAGQNDTPSREPPASETGGMYPADAILAIGGELKNSFCIAKNHLYYLSPYLGDMQDIRMLDAFGKSTARLGRLLETDFHTVACDIHPDYHTRKAAYGMGLPVCQIQHHYAHILSCMAENNAAGPVIGVSFDGTGYGSDGTIWGGEILLAEYTGFKRLGCIRPFAQTGGDRAAREGWRIAAGMIYEQTDYNQEETRQIVKKLELCNDMELSALFFMIDNHMQTVVSTSAGRVFDAVSAILGLRRVSTYEGEAATALMAAAQRYMKNHSISVSASFPPDAKDSGKKPITVSRNSDRPQILSSSSDRSKAGHPGTGTPQILPEPRTGGKVDPRSVYDPAAAGRKIAVPQSAPDELFYLTTDRIFHKILSERLDGGDPDRLAYDFHRMLADQITEACALAWGCTGAETVALSGGVFQNTLLLELCETRLSEYAFTVLRHHMLPPNDGGIALGQAIAANAIKHNIS